MNVLFFLTVPTRAKPFCNRVAARNMSVKKLSLVIFFPLWLKGADNSNTTFRPIFC